jgi:hypothetical protein
VVVVAVEILLHHMLVPQVDLVVVAEVIELLQPEEMALVIHSQAHLEPHLQTDGDILVELLLTQVLVVEVVVPEASVVMVIMVMEHLVEQVFNFLQHIEIHNLVSGSLDQVVVDIG